MQPSVEEAVRLAMTICEQYNTADEPEIIVLLEKAGIETQLAHDLTTFVPLGFTRALLDTSGANFQLTYLRIHAQTQAQTRHMLAEQPIFTAAYQLAQQLVRQGYDRERFFAIAGRSAEMHALNQALHAGSKIEDLIFSEPMVFDYDETQRPKQPWWRFWQQA